MGQRGTTTRQLLSTQRCQKQVPICRSNPPTSYFFSFLTIPLSLSLSLSLSFSLSNVLHLEQDNFTRMNKKNLFFFPKLSLIYSYIIFFYLLTRTTLCYVDPKFEACGPKFCGNQSISYPFYIQGIQESYCGYPGFGLSCNNNFPILNLSSNLYIIDKIFYYNQSLRVSNVVFSRSNTDKGCLSPIQNFTFPNNMFHLAPNQREVILFFGCDSLSVPRKLQGNTIGCSAEREKSSVVALYKEDKNVSFMSKNCTGEVVDTTVENDDVEGGIQEALRRGFWLNWTASDCSVCNYTGGRCGFDKSIFTFKCYCADRVHAATCDSVEGTGKHGMHLMVLVVAIVSSLAGMAVLVVLACYYRTKIFPSAFLLFKKENPTHQIIEEFLKAFGPLPATRYSYSDLKKITNSFNNKLGQGGYGSVYKGKLPDGSIVAVKVLSESKGNGEDFINEVASISRTSHVSIVRLLGFCLDGYKKALIYEFMPNGSLEKFIYEDKHPLKEDHQLNCKTLHDIAVGVARGLEYLHRGCNTRILHFDIKPHNILLDEDFCPKISDFGLAKICPRKESIVSMFGVRGTVGYIAPELFSRNFGGVSHKSDVYSYGMMVLEMVGAKWNNNVVDVERSSEIYFPHWVYERLEHNQEPELRIIKNEIDKEMVRKMVIVSLWCIQTNPSNRPSMSKVVEMMEGKLESLQIPPKPFLTSPQTSHMINEITSEHSSWVAQSNSIPSVLN